MGAAAGMGAHSSASGFPEVCKCWGLVCVTGPGPLITWSAMLGSCGPGHSWSPPSRQLIELHHEAMHRSLIQFIF